MWLFLPDGFLSIVADHHDPTGPRLLVRARMADHITAYFPSAEVSSTGGSDYRFRAWVPRAAVASALARFAENLDYGNFKNQVSDDRYHHACLETWWVMRGYQEEQGA